MVRNYVRKTEKGKGYSKAQLKSALDDVAKGIRTISAASKFYSIPNQTLRDHSSGRRGKSKGLGRAPAIPYELESSLANGKINDLLRFT